MNRAGMDLKLELARGPRFIAPTADRLDVDRDLLRDAEEWIRERERRAFATGDDGRWAPDDPHTVRVKGSDRVLVEHGFLRNALTVAGAPGSRTTYQGDSVTVSTNLLSGLMAERGARGMPVRRPVPPVRREELGDLADDLLTELTRRRR